MKTILISTALFTAPLLGTVTAQSTTPALTNLVNEQERQIQELKSEVSSLRSLLNLERRRNGKASLPDTTNTKSNASTHTVKSGDTFSSISRKYGVSVSALIVANPRVKPSNMAIDQKLVIPSTNSKAVASAPRQTSKPARNVQTISHSTQTSNATTYKVAKGDTFYDIAKQHNISLSALSSANPGINPNRLKIGQTVNLTKNTPKVNKAAQDTKKNRAYKSLPKVVKQSSPPPTKSKTTLASYKTTPSTTREAYIHQPKNIAHTVPVTQQTTYGAFAKKHGTTIAVLNTLNGLEHPADEPMAIGSELFIPNR